MIDVVVKRSSLIIGVVVKMSCYPDRPSSEEE